MSQGKDLDSCLGLQHFSLCNKLLELCASTKLCMAIQKFTKSGNNLKLVAAKFSSLNRLTDHSFNVVV